jgi:hypothetical protein
LKLIDGTEEEIARVAMEIAANMDEYDAASAGVLTNFLIWMRFQLAWREQGP